MNISHPTLQRPSLWNFLTHAIVGLFVAILFAAVGAPAHAAAPPAGASISNQASATYSDGSGVQRNVSSNLVTTSVTQVYSLQLTNSGAQNATPGSVVYYPHTVTNTGNGNDSFTLAANTGSGGFAMSSALIYADNGSGQPTGSAISSTGVLASGASFKFIVAAQLPTNVSNSQTNALTVTATSTGDASGNTKQPNTDTTTVTSSAVVTLTKAISVSTGNPGTAITYTLTYTNTGNSDATAVQITDTVPSGMTWTTGSARWSVTGSTALNDGTTAASVGTGGNTITTSLSSAGLFTATIAKVAAGQSGYITFGVTVNSTGVGPGVIPNTAGLQYNNGTGNVNGTSNTVPFTVSQTAGVTLTPDTWIPAAAAGSTISFKNVVVNNGNGTDTFNITLSGSNFPAGTVFQLYKSDGTTPLVDTNGDGVVDTGPVLPGAANAYNVILKATLPPNATGSSTFSVTKTATSVFDKTQFSAGADQLTGGITAAAVDLTNKIPPMTGSAGTGTTTAGEAAAQVTTTANPGTTTVFTLVAKNTGPQPDSYDLAAAQSSDLATALPTGWSVVFKADGGAGNCSSTGATITNTGSIASSGSTTVCAFVTIPSGYDAVTVNVYFRTLSPTSAAKDILHDAVTVNAVRSLTIAPNGTGQTYPGGSVYYVHTLTNNGNVIEGGANSTITPTLANNTANWSATIYYDANGNGQLDATDPLITTTLNAVLPTGTIAKGASVTLLVKVIAPSGAAAGTVNNTTVTVDTVNASGGYSSTPPTATVSTDATSVIAGNLTLAKYQALDADCNGVADGGASSYTQGNLSAAPGQCVLYQIVVTNVGAADATNVVVSDGTPSYTTISTAAATAAPGQITGPTVGTAGAITAYIGTGATTSKGGILAAGQSATITFGVKVAN